MYNIVEILADGTEHIINSAPYRSAGEAWADARWIALAERQMGSTSKSRSPRVNEQALWV